MQALIDFLGGLVVPSGRRAGQLLEVYPYQRRFLRGAFSQPDDAALSMGRAGGKTTLAAGILTATIAGPARQTECRKRPR